MKTFTQGCVARSGWAAILTEMLILLAIMSGVAKAAPILDQAGKKNVVIYCEVKADGSTTCSVSRGEISACAEREADIIQRSFHLFDYLPSPRGCTLDTAYWRNHSLTGSRPYDATWDRIGSRGESTVFFDRNRTYLAMLANDNPTTAYDRLARAFVTTELNRLNRAILPDEVKAAFDRASTLLIRSTPTSITAEDSEFDRLADILNAHATGTLGPGRCAPATDIFDTADIGKTIVGLISQDTGTVQNILPKPGGADNDGEGIAVISPASGDDIFDIADEDFTVDGVRVGRFTQNLNNCVTAEAGQEFTLASGQNPQPPTNISQDQRADARDLQIMIALNDETPDEASTDPAAGGPGPPAPTTPPATPVAPATPDQQPSLAFPSDTLPATNDASGTNIDLVTVPNVIGLTESEATDTLNDAGLIVGSVIIVNIEDPKKIRRLVLIAAAHAQDQTVIKQRPSAGANVVPGTSVTLTLGSDTEDVPEPSSLLLFLAALLIVGFFFWRQSQQTNGTA